MHHFTIVLPTGHQRFTTDGRFIIGANVQTCAVNADAARLAVFTLAGEHNAAIIRAERWARVGLTHCQRVEPGDLPSAPAAVFVREQRAVYACTRGATRAEDSSAIRMQARMCAEEGTADYRAAWQAKMDRYLAAHPNPAPKPAPQPRPFAPVPTVQAAPAIAFDNELVKISGQYTDRGAFHRALMIARQMLESGEWDGKSELWIDDPYAAYNKLSDTPPAQTAAPTIERKPRHILTFEDRRKAGRTTASKPAPSGRACPYCRVSSDGFSTHLAFAGHIGFCAFARKYANGDKKLAGDMLSRKGLSVIDPMPRNGAWQRGSNSLAA
jgi:hypothetical protein